MLQRLTTRISHAAEAVTHEDSPFLLTRGYDFGARIWRRARPGARSAPMRLLGDEAALVRGAEGIDLFYDESRIARHGAMPAIVQETLFGHGSVHSLDGAAHRHRKATFVTAAYEDHQVARLTPWLEREWARERDAWLDGGTRSAYDAAVGAFGRAIMGWAGLPGTAAAKTRWAARLAQIVDGFGVPYSPEYLVATMNRVWSDRHAQRLIEAVRDGSLTAGEDTALSLWAGHRDAEGALLPAKTAGIELQNSIRPMIAAARFWRSQPRSCMTAPNGAPASRPRPRSAGPWSADRWRPCSRRRCAARGCSCRCCPGVPSPTSRSTACGCRRAAAWCSTSSVPTPTSSRGRTRTASHRSASPM